MNILNRILIQPKAKVSERRVFFHRIYINEDTLKKLEELKKMLEGKTNHFNTNKEQQAEMFRKIIGIAYHDIKHDMENDGKIKKYIKFIIMKKNGRKKKLIREYYLKRAI